VRTTGYTITAISILVIVTLGVTGYTQQGRGESPAAVAQQRSAAPSPVALDPELSARYRDKKLQSKSSSDGPHQVASAGQQCHSNVCQPGGCARCRNLSVTLPLTAQVAAVRCFTTANYPDDVGLREVGCGQDVAWSYFSWPTETTKPGSPGNKFVEATYFNRSHNRARTVRLQVDYTE
jgi:hypothetical protein